MIQAISDNISIIAACFSAGGAVYVAFDAYTSRRPYVVVSQGKVKVSNPRKKAVLIHTVGFKGEAVLVYREKENQYGEPVPEPVSGFQYFADQVIPAGETISLALPIHLEQGKKYSASLRRHFINGNTFSVTVKVY